MLGWKAKAGHKGAGGLLWHNMILSKLLGKL